MPEAPANDAAGEPRTERSGRRNRNNRRGRRDRDEGAANNANRPFIPNDEINTSPSSMAAELVIVTPEAAVVESKPAVAPVVIVTETQTSAVADADATPSNKTTAPKAKTEGRKPKAAKVAEAVTADNSAPSEASEPANNVSLEVIDTPVKAENKRPARPRKPKAEAKPVDLTAVGLQLVETKASTAKVAEPVETVKASTPRKAAAWQQKAKEDANAEPLVMVETQNK